MELREHLADLTEQGLASGLDTKVASDRARALLGSDALLTRAVIDTGAPRSFAARAPWAVLFVLPAVVLLGVLWANAVSMLHVLWPLRKMAIAEMPESYRGLIAFVSFAMNDLFGALVAAGCIVIALRQRLTSRWLWVGVCFVALTSACLGFHTHVVVPPGSHRGATMFSVAAIVYRHGHADLAATVAAVALHAGMLCALAMVVCWSLRRRFEALGAVDVEI